MRRFFPRLFFRCFFILALFASGNCEEPIEAEIVRVSAACPDSPIGRRFEAIVLKENIEFDLQSERLARLCRKRLVTATYEILTVITDDGSLYRTELGAAGLLALPREEELREWHRSLKKTNFAFCQKRGTDKWLSVWNKDSQSYSTTTLEGINRGEFELNGDQIIIIKNVAKTKSGRAGACRVSGVDIVARIVGLSALSRDRVKEIVTEMTKSYSGAGASVFVSLYQTDFINPESLPLYPGMEYLRNPSAAPGSVEVHYWKDSRTGRETFRFSGM